MLSSHVKLFYQKRHSVFLLGNMTIVEPAGVSLSTDRCVQATCNGLTLMFDTELCGALECVWPIGQSRQRHLSSPTTHKHTLYRMKPSINSYFSVHVVMFGDWWFPFLEKYTLFFFLNLQPFELFITTKLIMRGQLMCTVWDCFWRPVMI